MADKINWLGRDFSIYLPTTNWSKTCGGVYLFCRVNAQNQWEPVYVGQCDCFCDRLTTHERWDEAARLGATHVHAAAEAQAAMRDDLEARLIQAFQPPLNTHFR